MAEIFIEKAGNGYIITSYDELNPKMVIEYPEKDEYDEQRAMFVLLNNIKNIFGVYSSKHNKVNCRVILEGEDEQNTTKSI